ncbi:MAG: alpha/beta hydrolase [Ruminococcaceae bacterium]|nr:alpha/beta hydrolase [Oscillospiraceae bacterium]
MKTTTKLSLAAVGAACALSAASRYFYRFAVLKRKNYDNIWASETKPQPYAKLRDCDREKVARGIDFIFESRPEEITITSHEGLRLAGHFIPHENPKGIFVMVHGYRSNPSNDFSGAVLPIYNMGFSLLLIDHRAHGNSQGQHITFGVKERFDLVRWCRYLKKRFPDLPVVLDGVSMGASTVMLAAGLALPDNVKALIADCGYTSPAEICKHCLKKWYKLPPFPLFYTANSVVKKYAGFSLTDGDCREALSRNRLPILIAHGTADDFVPYRMGQENFEACRGSNAIFFSVTGAEHGMSYIIDPEGYTEKMKELFRMAGIEWE